MNWKTLRDPMMYVLIVGAVIFIWYYIGVWIDTNVTAGETKDQLITAARGQFGDKFGAVNALFSGLAFAGIIITLLLQKRDLKETRNVMGHERFDNTFFQLLSLHMDIVTRLRAKGWTGIEAFEAFAEHLKTCDQDFHGFAALQKISRDKVREIIDSRNITSAIYPEFTPSDISNLTERLKSGVQTFENFLDANKEMHKAKIIKAYTKSSVEYIDNFSHYFRNLYHLLKFVHDSNLIDYDEKKIYSKFVRSQLSDVELVCLFYNSISKIQLPGREDMELGYPKMKAYLKEYDILQNMNPRSLIHPIHKDIFEEN